jgi:hypothetical protein
MITSITTAQSNLLEGYVTLSIHNPLLVLVDATYTGVTPDYIYCAIEINRTAIGSFRCVALEDLSLTQRTFMLKVDSIVKSYMDLFDDVTSTVGILESVPEFTAEVNLTFTDPLNEGATPLELYFIALHASREIGENPCVSEIEDNVSDTYYAWGSHPVYVYFFNNDINNTLSLETIEPEIILDYDDTEFSDYDDELFTSTFD